MVDPEWQRKFSTIWSIVLALFIFLSLPHLIRSIRSGRAYNTLPGISEHFNDKGNYVVAATGQSTSSGSQAFKKSRRWMTSLQSLCGAIGSVFYWTLPGFILNAGQSSCFLPLAWSLY